MESAVEGANGTALAFAVVDADLAVDDLEFYGLPVVVDSVGDVGLASVAGSESPSATDEVILAFHNVVAELAKRGACLPHRFGSLVDRGRARSDSLTNHDVLVAALDAVRGRSEVLVRARVVPGDLVQVLGPEAAALQQLDDPIDIGRAVHALAGPLLQRHVAEACDTIRPTTPLAFGDIHDDGLGADVVVALRDDEFPMVEPAFETLLTYCELERFDATPCYRSAARLTADLVNDAA